MSEALDASHRFHYDSFFLSLAILLILQASVRYIFLSYLMFHLLYVLLTSHIRSYTGRPPLPPHIVAPQRLEDLSLRSFPNDLSMFRISPMFHQINLNL